MSVIYTTAVKNARLQAVIDQIGATGVLEICTTGYAAVLATFPLPNPAGTVSAGVLTLDFDPDITDASADNTGTAAIARIRTASGGTDIVTGLTVGLSGAEVNIDNLSINAGQTVTLTAASIAHA